MRKKKNTKNKKQQQQQIPFIPKKEYYHHDVVYSGIIKGVIVSAVLVGIVFIVIKVQKSQTSPSSSFQQQKKQKQKQLPNQNPPKTTNNYNFSNATKATLGILGTTAALGSLYVGRKFLPKKSLSHEEARHLSLIKYALNNNDDNNEFVVAHQFSRPRKRVMGDGNCFYRSVAEFVYGSQSHWQQVKQDLINFYKSGESETVKLIKAVSPEDFRDLLQQLNNNGEFAGEHAIALAQEV